MKKINKKYFEIMHEVELANGRKEVISLLKRASKLKLLSEEKLYV